MTDDRLATQLRRLGTPAHVGAGTVLATEGTPGRTAFVVVDGIARVTLNGRLLAHIGPDEFVGEVALIDHGSHVATVTADDAMHVLAFDAPAFAELLGDVYVTGALLRALVTRLRAAVRGDTGSTALRPQRPAGNNQQEEMS